MGVEKRARGPATQNYPRQKPSVSGLRMAIREPDPESPSGLDDMPLDRAMRPIAIGANTRSRSSPAAIKGFKRTLPRL